MINYKWLTEYAEEYAKFITNCKDCRYRDDIQNLEDEVSIFDGICTIKNTYVMNVWCCDEWESKI